MNSVTLLGRVGNDPELKYLPNGSSVCNFSLATTDKWKDKQGVQQEKTSWHNCAVWGKQAESFTQYVKKGQQILILGKVVYSDYDKDGVKMYKTEIKCVQIEYLGLTGATDNHDPTDKSENFDNTADIPF